MSNGCAFNSDGQCRHAAVGGDATPSKCAACDHYAGRLRGMGDVFHVALSAVGIPSVVKAVAGDCNCGPRRAAMNAALPFADKPNTET
jgi:hypothetical protein